MQKNWDGTLREEMLQQNIFCYGKPGSGKTEKVAKPFMRYAIERGNSILLVDNGGADYEDIAEMALDAGYEVGSYAPWYFTEHSYAEVCEEGERLMTALLSKRTLVRICPDVQKRHIYNSVTEALRWLHSAERNNLEDVECNVSLVMENSDWEIFVPGEVGNCNWLNFCITADCRRLTVEDNVNKRYQTVRNYLAAECEDVKSDLRDQVRQAAATKDVLAVKKLLDQNVYMDAYAGTMDPHLAYSQKNIDLIREHNKRVSDKTIYDFARGTLYNALVDFFYNVQTVICTGLAGIVPGEAKSFLYSFVLTPGIAAPGGKFLITELTPPGQPIPKSQLPKTVLKFGKDPVEEILIEHFRPGKCVIEQNGVAKMYVNWECGLVPLCFATAARAMDWLELYFTQMGWGWPEPVEMDACSFRYLLPTVNEKGQQDEIIVSYIQPDDVQAYVDQAMMITMEVEEYLTNPALMEEVPGLDRKKDAANTTMQKLVNYACRNYHRVRKIGNAQLPVDEETQEPVASLFEEYQWRPYQKVAAAEPALEPEQAVDILPDRKILFLGGHANMVKKLRQYFPNWSFLTDDELGNWTGGECEAIFFWSKHCSHKIMQYVNVRKNKETAYIYVTATNIDRLIGEMAQKYKAHKAKQAEMLTTV